MAKDTSPAVRREVALAMRDVPYDQAKDVLISLWQKFMMGKIATTWKH